MTVACFEEFKQAYVYMKNKNGFSLWYENNDEEIQFIDYLPQNYPSITIGTFANKSDAKERFLEMSKDPHWNIIITKF